MADDPATGEVLDDQTRISTDDATDEFPADLLLFLLRLRLLTLQLSLLLPRVLLLRVLLLLLPLF